MDKTKLKGKVKQLRGKIKVWWSRLSVNDLDRIAGKFDLLVSELQDKYGYSRRQAVQKVSQRIIDYRSANRNPLKKSRFD